MLFVALAMYKLYWVELRQKNADERPSKRHRTEVMPPLRLRTPSRKSPALWAVLGVCCGTFSL